LLRLCFALHYPTITHFQAVDACINIDSVGEINAQQDYVQIKEVSNVQAITYEVAYREWHGDNGGTCKCPNDWHHEEKREYKFVSPGQVDHIIGESQ